MGTEQKEEEVYIIKELRARPEMIVATLSCLTDLEQKIISVLYQEGKALSIKMIRFMLIANTTIRNFYLMRLRSPNKEKTYPFNSYYLLTDEQRKEIYEKLIVFPSNVKEIKEVQDKVESLYSFPAFERVERTIKDLIKMKMVIERSSEELEDSKVKGLYFLNPEIRVALKKEESKS